MSQGQNVRREVRWDFLPVHGLPRTPLCKGMPEAGRLHALCGSPHVQEDVLGHKVLQRLLVLEASCVRDGRGGQLGPVHQLQKQQILAPLLLVA